MTLSSVDGVQFTSLPTKTYINWSPTSIPKEWISTKLLWTAGVHCNWQSTKTTLKVTKTNYLNELAVLKTLLGIKETNVNALTAKGLALNLACKSGKLNTV
jgi:hypothetical protein